ncbi:MAG: molybdopterin molybdotransferase MoeA, partial [Proteobacteria bacterium]|nr:molybdopterin molybdotransferase MoeA [Pseudomonadota bacterium]
MNDFCTQAPPAEFLAGFAGFTPLPAESIPLAQARNRVVAAQLTSPEPLPAHSRSLMDGYAVRAADTLGSCQSTPVLLSVIGEIATGISGQKLALEPGQAIHIWTGGELPQGADGVVMAEHTRLVDQETVAVFEPISLADNTVKAGEDYGPGTMLFTPGHRLRAQDLGLLAALGFTTVPVFRRPRVAILSTGDELVPPDQIPPPGKVRNINSISLAALVEEAGGLPLP